MDISRNTDAIKDFAHKQGIDLKYLVDGANFVISKMHFNNENNYYITLGLPQGASQDEIRERWKRLMLLYHPDRQEGDEEWVSERAKKVNEAYSVLKDDSKRTVFDRKLKEQALNQKTLTHPAAGTRTHSRRRTDKSPVSPVWAGSKKHIPRVLVGLYILVAMIIIGSIYLQNQSSLLETELFSGGQQATQTAVIPPAPPARVESGDLEADKGNNISGDLRPQPEITPDRIIDNRQFEASERNNAMKERQIYYQEKRPKEQTKKIPDEPNDVKQAQKSPEINLPRNDERDREIKANITKQIGSPVLNRPLPPSPDPGIRKDETLARRDEQQRDAVHKSETAHIPQTTVVQKTLKQPEPPAGRIIQEAKAVHPASPKTNGITKEEVEDFMQRYVNSYNRNDLNAFMSLFSRSAVENNIMDYDEIRNAYRENFDEKINYYKLQNMHIKIEGINALVYGTYNINRYLSAEDRWLRFSGKISWKLSRENNSLKIVSINYDK